MNLEPNNPPNNLFIYYLNKNMFIVHNKIPEVHVNIEYKRELGVNLNHKNIGV